MLNPVRTGEDLGVPKGTSFHAVGQFIEEAGNAPRRLSQGDLMSYGPIANAAPGIGQQPTF